MNAKIRTHATTNKLNLPILSSLGSDWLLMTSTAHLAATTCCTESMLMNPQSSELGFESELPSSLVCSLLGPW